MPTHAELKLFPYSTEQIFKLIVDVEYYPAFLPWIFHVCIEEKKEDSFIATLTVGYKFLKETYTSQVHTTPFERVDIRYIKGPFRYLNNRWILKEVGPHKTLIDFYIDFEFKASWFQSILQPVFLYAVTYIVQSFEKRAQELYGWSPSLIS